MRKLFPLLFAAAVGATTIYFVMAARPVAPAAPAVMAQSEPPQLGGKTVSPKSEIPASESPRKSGSPKFGGGNKGGFLPEEIDGVSPEQLSKCKVALFKTFQDETVKAARAKLTELRKEAEYASDDDKKNMRTQFEDIANEVRQATKAAVLAADAELTDEVVDKVLDAVEERMKQRGQGFQKGKK